MFYQVSDMVIWVILIVVRVRQILAHAVEVGQDIFLHILQKFMQLTLREELVHFFVIDIGELVVLYNLADDLGHY
ncbi:hypothetical protein D3C85_1490400 [compost metagenome]